MAREQHVRRWLDAMATRPEEYSVCGRLFTSAVVLADGLCGATDRTNDEAPLASPA